MEKKITSTMPKSEILEAYKELLEKVQNQKIEDPRVVKEIENKKETVKNASLHSSETIIKGIAELKLNIGNSLDKLEESLMTEYRKLSQIREAVEIETKNLDELYQIKVNADSLAALLMAQKEKRLQLEAEIQRKKEVFEEEKEETESKWAKEKKEREAMLKEQEALLKKQRQREEEEYQYNILIQKKKDEDAYLAKKSALEKEITEKKMAFEKELSEKKIAFEKEVSEREAFIAAKEKEWAELTKKVESFPSDLEKAIKQTEKAIQEKIETKYKFEAELTDKETEGERMLNKQIISNLEAKIKEQTTLIAQLTQKADYAGDQVNNIAVKALEGAANMRFQIKEKSERNTEEPGPK
ncbi:MAG: hypothetical protein NTU44_13065 [Bacteroidetes bacterium]|nr:hypothetical protein [Bacteroidota bacterium]